jgi:hypothetical protein
MYRSSYSPLRRSVSRATGKMRRDSGLCQAMNSVRTSGVIRPGSLPRQRSAPLLGAPCRPRVVVRPAGAAVGSFQRTALARQVPRRYETASCFASPADHAPLAGAVFWQRPSSWPARRQRGGRALCSQRGARARPGDAAERAAASSISLHGPARSDWHYIPRSRSGVAWRDMNAAQREATSKLLRSALSGRGHGQGARA